MTKHPTPITVFCRDVDHAHRLSIKDLGSAALRTGPGTMAFHTLLAQHGAQAFQTLYVPIALRGQFKTPVGGIVKFAEGASEDA